MEQLRQRRDEGGAPEALRRRTDQELVWTGRDELPPDEGRWLYVVDGMALAAGQDVGAWVSADLDRDLAAMAVCQAIGRMNARMDLVVIDQVGFDRNEDGGGEMVDEDYFVPARFPR